MTQRTGQFAAGLVLASLVLTAAAARAEPLQVKATLKNVSPGVRINFTINDQPGLPDPLPVHSTTAGVFNWTTVSSNAGFAPTFTSFCIELNQHISTGGTYTYDVIDVENAPNPGQGTGGPGVNGPMGLDRANQIRQLWGTHFAEIGSDNVKAAAFQLAIWEIIYTEWFTPTPYAGGGATVLANGTAAIDLAMQWWNEVQTPDPTKYQHGLVANSSLIAQDEITLLTPAPRSFLLAGLGGLGLIGYVRRRRQFA